MDQLTRIEILLERIAVALEEQNQTVTVPHPDATRPTYPPDPSWQYNPGPYSQYVGDGNPVPQEFNIDYSLMGDK